MKFINNILNWGINLGDYIQLYTIHIEQKPDNE